MACNKPIKEFSSHLISLPALTDRSVARGLTVGVDAAGALGAGVRVTSHEGVSSIARRTLADGSVAWKYNIVQHQRRYSVDSLSIHVEVIQNSTWIA